MAYILQLILMTFPGLPVTQLSFFFYLSESAPQTVQQVTHQQKYFFVQLKKSEISIMLHFWLWEFLKVWILEDKAALKGFLVFVLFRLSSLKIFDFYIKVQHLVKTLISTTRWISLTFEDARRPNVKFGPVFSSISQNQSKTDMFFSGPIPIISSQGGR